MKKFKPSKAQQVVINFLFENEGSYILYRPHHDWQHYVKINGKIPFENEACKITTLKALIKNKVLQKKDNHANRFCLTQSFFKQNIEYLQTNEKIQTIQGTTKGN